MMQKHIFLGKLSFKEQFFTFLAATFHLNTSHFVKEELDYIRMNYHMTETYQVCRHSLFKLFMYRYGLCVHEIFSVFR
jgi:hypothetical protein